MGNNPMSRARRAAVVERAVETAARQLGHQDDALYALRPVAGRAA